MTPPLVMVALPARAWAKLLEGPKGRMAVIPNPGTERCVPVSVAPPLFVVLSTLMPLGANCIEVRVSGNTVPLTGAGPLPSKAGPPELATCAAAGLVPAVAGAAAAMLGFAFHH